MTDEHDTPGVLANLFETLRNYSQARKISDEELLRQRARQYAETDKDTRRHAVGETLTMITFTLNGEHYGLDVTRVQSVRPLPKVTRVPNAPPFFTGVANVRGAVVTLLDLSAFFGMGHAENVAELIIIEAGDLTLGLPVTRVMDVTTIPLKQVTGLDDMRYAIGMYGRVVVLEADEIFNDERIPRG